MVLPLVDEDKPKCHLCHEGLDDIESLRNHLAASHEDAVAVNDDGGGGSGGSGTIERGPAPGDVAIF